MGEAAQRLSVHQDTKLLVLTNNLHLGIRGKVEANVMISYFFIRQVKLSQVKSKSDKIFKSLIEKT